MEGLEGCKNIWKEPRDFYTKKKVRKVLEGLEDCKNIWKEPRDYYTKKKERKVLEGLEGCKNIWKEPRDYYTVKKNNTQCSFCRGVGHNTRTCPLMCAPCVLPTGETASKAEVRAANTLALLFV